LSTAALAIALAAAGTAAYLIERSSLSNELNALLRARAAQVTPAVVQQVLGVNGLLPKQRAANLNSRANATLGQIRSSRSAPGAVLGFADLQLVTSDGERALASRSGATSALPVDALTRAIARGSASSVFRTATIHGQSLRIYVFRAAPGVAGEVEAPLAEVNGSLHNLQLTFAGIGMGALLLVASLGSLVARQAIRPVTALSRAAESVVETGDLRQRVGVPGGGRDELGRLATTINAMLAALERSVGSQRQLVADASHELRTPLTTLMTNLQLLDEPGGLQTSDAPELVTQARRQSEELAALVSDVVELARSGEVKLHLDDVRLDLVAAAAVERVRSHTVDVLFRTHLSPCSVWGDAELLERAIGNLLENAAKWSPPEGSVDVRVGNGEVVVRDDGPGIAASDLPFVFDRFYRSAGARGQPGSGLGLAIVRQIAELHGGVVTATSGERGAVLRLTLPSLAGPRPPVPPTRAPKIGVKGESASS
jgi:two-component system sensor histidine kinase MprB